MYNGEKRITIRYHLMKTTENKHLQSKQILKKHVAAIHIGAKLSLLQRKLVNALLYNAYEGLLTAREHTISASVLCEMIGFDSKNIAYLKASLKGLMETVVEFDVMEDDGEQSWEAMVLLPYAKIKGGVCTYRYERALAEKLYHPDIFSKINLSVLREMNSSHSLVLYENCHRYLGTGQTAVWDIDVFRRLMGVEDRYKEFKILRRDVINPAMKEVNQVSNINLELITSRRGRQVAAVQFLVRPNPQQSLLSMEEDDAINKTAAYKALLAEGISKTLARAWAIEYDEAYIFEKLDLAQDQAASGKIKSSKAGFLKSAIEEDYHSENAQKKKHLEIVQSTKQVRQKVEAELEALKAAQRESETAYRWNVAAIIEDAFDALPESQKEDVMAEFEASFTSLIYKNAFRKSGWKDRLSFPNIMKFWAARGLSLPSPAGFAKAQGSKEPAVLKAAIEATEEALKKL